MHQVRTHSRTTLLSSAASFVLTTNGPFVWRNVRYRQHLTKCCQKNNDIMHRLLSLKSPCPCYNDKTFFVIHHSEYKQKHTLCTNKGGHFSNSTQSTILSFNFQTFVFLDWRNLSSPRCVVCLNEACTQDFVLKRKTQNSCREVQIAFQTVRWVVERSLFSDSEHLLIWCYVTKSHGDQKKWSFQKCLER